MKRIIKSLLSGITAFTIIGVPLPITETTSLMGLQSISVSAEENDIQDISFTPNKDFIIYDDGYWNSEGFIYNFDENDFAADVTYSDGSKSHFDSVEDFINSGGYQYYSFEIVGNYDYGVKFEDWGVGKHTVEFFNYLNEDDKFTTEINIVESPIESFTISSTRDKYYENTNIQHLYSHEIYSPESYNLTINVTYKDGSTESLPVYEYYYVDNDDSCGQWDTNGMNENGLKISAFYIDQIENPWIYDKENPKNNMHQIEMRCQGITSYFDVEIIQNPYTSIDFEFVKPITIAKGVNTRSDGMTDEDGNPILNYNFPYDYLKITMHGVDGTDTVFNGFSSELYKFEEEVGYYLSENCADEAWDIGTHYFNVSFFGHEGKLPVEIIENPVESIKIENSLPVTIEQNTGGWENGDFYYYTYGILDKLSFTINYKNGTKETGVNYDELLDYAMTLGDEEHDDLFSIQSDANGWDIGIHSATLSVLGFTIDYGVKIVEGEPVELLPGDANHDGMINGNDLVAIKKYLSGQYDDISSSIDLNEDNKINAFDVILMKKMLNK